MARVAIWITLCLITLAVVAGFLYACYTSVMLQAQGATEFTTGHTGNVAGSLGVLSVILCIILAVLYFSTEGH